MYVSIYSMYLWARAVPIFVKIFIKIKKIIQKVGAGGGGLKSFGSRPQNNSHWIWTELNCYGGGASFGLLWSRPMFFVGDSIVPAAALNMLYLKCFLQLVLSFSGEFVRAVLGQEAMSKMLTKNIMNIFIDQKWFQPVHHKIYSYCPHGAIDRAVQCCD